MPVLYLTHERFLDHDTGRGHPERPARLVAVERGIDAAGLRDALVPVPPRVATLEELGAVHRAELLDGLAALGAAGGGAVDPDTTMGPASLEAARLAAGAGLAAVEHLERGEATAAFCAVRPPGHHATPTSSMGFCLLNNVAVTARALVDRGERVLIVDYDAHHGNGTQDAFWDDPRVLYVSLHQFPLYPGTGSLREVGGVHARGTTINVPFPPGTSGEAYRAAFDRVVTPAAASFAPTWLLISAGFDGHRADPLTDLALSAGDVGDLTARLLGLVPPGRTVAFFEGGYDLDALEACAAACVGALAGTPVATESLTTGSTGTEVALAAELVRAELVELG